MAIRLLSNQTIDSTLTTTGAITSGGNLRTSSGVLYVGDGSNTTARIMGFGDYEMITGVSGATYLRVSGSSTLAGTLQSGQYILAAGLAYGVVNNFTQIIDGGTGAITGTTASFTASITAAGNSNSFGNTTIGGLTASSATVSGSINVSGNSNVLGTTTVAGNLIIDNTSSAATQTYKFNTAGDGVIVGDINFNTNAAEGNDDRIGLIRSRTSGGAATSRGGELLFYTRKSGSADFNLTTYDKNGDWTFPGSVTFTSNIYADRYYADTITKQTDALFIGRQNGNIVEFGHNNQSAQYYGVLGVQGSSGYPFVGFSCDVDYGANTFTTRGAKGNVIQGSGGNLSFQTVDNTNATGQTPNTRMFIKNDGNVGIGTDSPTSGKLEVQQTATTAALWVQSGGTTDSYSIADFRTGTNASALAVKANGRVGIGVTSPSQPLHVLGNIKTFGNIFLQSNANGFRTVALDTTDGADNQELYLCGGGTASSTRGGQVGVYGNEVSGTGGSVVIVAGNVSTGDIDFLTANSQRMIIENSGNVGIGTTSPTNGKFVINQESSAASFGGNVCQLFENFNTTDGQMMSIGFRNNNSVGTTAYIDAVAYDQSIGATDLRFSTYSGSAWSSNMVTFQHTGRVGIGTTGPSYNLEIAGTANPKIAIVSNINSATSSLLFGDSDAKDRGQIVYTHFGDVMELKAAGGTRLYLESGINTAYTPDGLFNANATPSYWSHGNGQFKFGYMDNGSGLYSGAYCFNVKSTDGIPVTGREIGAVYIRDTSNNRMPLIISNQGRININQTNTSYGFGSSTGWLTIANGTSSYNFYNAYTGTDGGSGCARYRLNNTSPSFFDFYYTTTQVGYITTNGTDIFYANTSDYRLKEDLKSFDGMSLLKQIQVYDFKWKESDNRMYGVVAHELQEVVPQAVVGEKDEEKLQAVDYSKLVPVLIKSIQELEARVKELENN